jgi:predicted kinase
MGVPFEAREQICALIRHHQVPFFLLRKEDPFRQVALMSQYLRCDWLALVAEADMRGRVAQDQARILDEVALFAEYCREQGCLDKPWPFPSELARFHYLQEGGNDPHYVPFDDRRCEVVLMSGFPGVGKDSWVRRHLADWPVVSLDEIRDDLEIDPGDGQSAVIKEARERARAHLRRGESFVWNATNITRQVREQCIALFNDYKARIRIVYLEAPEVALHQQNKERAASVPRHVIERLVTKWEVPNVTEAHSVQWTVRE